jgi:hypothetical protein
VWLLAYLTGWAWTWGALFAYLQRGTEDRVAARTVWPLDSIAAGVASLIPVIWFQALFATAYYRHGWLAPWRNPQQAAPIKLP